MLGTISSVFSYAKTYSKPTDFNYFSIIVIAVTLQDNDEK